MGRVRIRVAESTDSSNLMHPSETGKKLFSPGHKKVAGRKPGTPNRVTTKLKDAILEAARLVGRDTKGENGLIGYLQRLAIKEPKVFGMLLGRVLPLQITGKDGGALEVTLRSAEEVKEALRERGLPVPDRIYH